MINLKDIQSLTEFQRKSRETIARLKRTGRPAILTVNGQAEIVVQDAEAYQKLLDRADQAEKLMELRRSISEYRAGDVRDAKKALAELEVRHLGRRRNRPSR